MYSTCDKKTYYKPLTRPQVQLPSDNNARELLMSNAVYFSYQQV